MEIIGIIEKGSYVLLGVLVTAITNHFLSKSRERQIHRAISFHEAAEKFRVPFDDTLFNIDQGQHTTHLLLQQFFTSHKFAMWHFKHRLVGRTRRRFQKAWDNYEQYYGKTYKKEELPANFASTKTDEERNNLDDLRQHIENIIKFIAYSGQQIFAPNAG